MSKTVNETKHHEQMFKIIGKARSLFAEKGYAETSMADIAEACKVQKPTLYHYFESKEALLFGILECHVPEDDVLDEFFKDFTDKNLEERLYQVAKYHLAETDKKEYFDFLKILMVETTTGNGRIKDYFQAYMRRHIDYFVKGVIEPLMKNRMSEIEMKRLAFQFVSSLLYYSWQTRTLGGLEDMVGLEDDYMRALAKTFGNQRF